MKQSEAVEKILELFPKLYYFIPQLKWQTVRAGRKEYVLIEENRGAILWLLEKLESEARAGTPQYELRKIVANWSPVLGESTRFSKELKGLVEIGLISVSRDYEGDARANMLKLTPVGRKVLESIKKQRAQLLSFMFGELSHDTLQNLVVAFEQMAQLTWEKMKDSKENMSIT
jgi:hypothetical protein